MNIRSLILLLLLSLPAALAADPALTIYNQGFAVVRDTVPLDLQAGVNTVRFAGTTAHVEPDSVILRDPAAKTNLQILEQNYRNDPVSEGLLLSLSEGKTINFLIKEQTKPDRIVEGKIIRSGYVVHSAAAMRRYGQHYYQSQMMMANPGGSTGQPIIEVEGQLRFSLPGQPIFPALADDAILKPTLIWQLQSDRPAKLDAELSYVSGGMEWEADYNILAPEKGDVLELTGWVTIDNQSGKTFPNARIKLMAGDVRKLQPDEMSSSFSRKEAAIPGLQALPGVSEKAFDEYHLYTLERPTTLHDRETKQVEFVRATGIQSQHIYVYDGAKIDLQLWGRQSMESIRQNAEYGTESNPKVWVMSEFKNSAANHLGMPLPRGRVRFYRRDGEQLQFTGENLIDHTPRDETLRIYTGNAFDLVGERRRTDFKTDHSNHWCRRILRN